MSREQDLRALKGRLSDVESTRPKVKSYSGRPSTDRAEEVAKRDILFHRVREEGMETTARNHTRKIWSP